MTIQIAPAPSDIRQARLDNPKARERDLASQLGISEAALVAANCGKGVRRIKPDVTALLNAAESLGEVMALTRNESAVHEKIGVYDKVHTGARNAMVLGADIDLRIFPAAWVHGFAVEKDDGEGGVRRSLQFFDAAGDAVHKIHLRPASNVEAYEALVRNLLSDDQSDTFSPAPASPADAAQPSDKVVDLDELRRRWTAMTDTHQFMGILRALDISRQQAVRSIGDDFAWPLDATGPSEVLTRAAATEDLPIMVFIGNDGCIQIHSGPVAKIVPMGPWINVMDPNFHLHLRTDHIAEAWAVRKPTKDGHVTSVEAYGADGRLIIQFFGKRKEGLAERPEWRSLVEGLPRLSRIDAA